MTKRVLVPLADGFEEIEAATIIDVLRRAGIEVKVASLGTPLVTGAHSLQFATDGSLDDFDGQDFEMIVLPGGMPGSSNLAASPKLKSMLQKHNSADKIIGAICAAPAVVLKPLGIFGSEKISCYPSYVSQIPSANRCEQRVSSSKHFITSCGPGTAIEFALELVVALVGKAKADELTEAMVVE